MKDKVPYMYEFLPAPPRLINHEPPGGNYDGIFALDCGNLFRVGKGHEQLKSQGPLINIDHHATNDFWCCECYQSKFIINSRDSL